MSLLDYCKAAVAIIGWKIDWISIRIPISLRSLNDSHIQEVIKLLGLKLVREKKRLVFRDDEKKICIKGLDKYTYVEFEGQYFSSPAKWQECRNVLCILNSKPVIIERDNIITEMYWWRISRVDPCVDLVNCEPVHLIPKLNKKEWYSFSAHRRTWENTKTCITENIEILSKCWTARAYRKDIEIKKLWKKKKGFYNIYAPEYKDKPITRLEIEIKGTEYTDHVNCIYKLEDISDETFVKSLFADFVSHKNIRTQLETDSNKSRWPLYWSWQLLSSGDLLPGDKELYIKAPQHKKPDNVLKFAKSVVTTALKEGRDKNQILKLVEDLFHEKKSS